nr:reverse transcriptase domain-containing protein [Tanacetum cinerariifolium]
MKEMRDGCNSYGGPYPSSECEDKPMGGPKEEEANYAYRGYRRGGFRGNYYGRNSRNWRDHQPRDDNQNSQPRDDNLFTPPTFKKKFEEFDFEKIMREFMVAQKSSNDFVKNQFFNLKTKVKQGQKNHQAAIQDLETKFGQLSDQCSTRPTSLLSSNTQTNLKPSPSNDKPYRPPPSRNKHVNAVFTRSDKIYDLPINPNTKTTVIHDDSEDEVNKAEKEELSSSKKDKSDPPPLKAYKPKIPYPQRLRKEKIEERYNQVFIQYLPTDLEMKPLPKHLEYAFLEKDSLLQVVISALLKNDEKKRLVSVLKFYKEAFA